MKKLKTLMPKTPLLCGFTVTEFDSMAGLASTAISDI